MTDKETQARRFLGRVAAKYQEARDARPAETEVERAVRESREKLEANKARFDAECHARDELRRLYPHAAGYALGKELRLPRELYDEICNLLARAQPQTPEFQRVHAEFHQYGRRVYRKGL